MSKNRTSLNGEPIVRGSRISIMSLLVYWLSVPSVLTVWCIQLYRSIQGKIRLAETLVGGDTAETVSHLAQDVMLGIALFLLVIWVIFCLVVTKGLRKNRLVFTETRAMGFSGKTELNTPLCEIKDVHVEQSLLGRIFNYGCVTLTAKRGSVSVKNIADPKQFRVWFLQHPEVFSGAHLL